MARPVKYPRLGCYELFEGTQKQRMIDLKAFWRDRPVVLTGARGFLGGHLIPALSGLGARVLALDIAPAWPGLPAGIAWRQADLCAKGALGLALEAAEIDPSQAVLFHLASLSMPYQCEDDPDRAQALTADLAMEMGRAWLTAGGRRMLFPSSALIYQPRPQGPDLGEDDPVSGRNAYTRAKLAAEQGLSALATEQDLALEMARLSNVYGPGAIAQTVLAEAMQKARDGQTPLMRAPGEVLDFLYVADAIQGLLRLAALEPVAGGRRTNLSTGQGHTVAQAAGIIARLAGVTPPPEGPGQPGHGKRLVLDNRRLRQLTGWAPQMALQEGLALTWAAGA